MTVESTKCDATRIARFLRHELPQQELEALIRHLDACSVCTAQLESETAQDKWWKAAGRFLADSDFDLEPLSDQSGPSDAPANDLLVQQVLDHLSPTDDPRRLGRIGGYEVAGVIGSGGMGVVLKAFDTALDRYVAIKTLSPALANSGSARKRFSREARAAAAVVHDNVSEIYGVAEAGGLPYLVMPYVRGTSLQRRLDDCGPLAPAQVLRIGMQTAAGLAAAHAQGLVHRDIKPANILLSEGVERVQITDFGLARAADDASLTRTGVIAGTPQYMSPEQARGDAVDHRSDLFSLGSVMYAACTGHPPFRAETSYAILKRIIDSRPRPIPEINPEIPAWLCAVIERLHAKSPEHRFQSAAEVADLLGQCLAHLQHPTSVAVPGPVLQLQKPAARSDPTGGALIRSRWRRLRSWFGNRARLTAWAGAASVLIAAAVIARAIIGLPSAGTRPPRRANRPPETASPKPVPESWTNVLPEQSAPTGGWQGDLQPTIVELDQDLREFEERAGLLWDNDAAGTR